MTAATPTFSVVIPSYNYAHFLPTTLRSVLAQQRDDVQLIVVDDASTDDTPDVVQPFIDAGVEYHRLDANVGPGRAWDHGLTLARGTYVCKLDADDWQLPGFLDTVEATFATDARIGAVVTSVWLHEDGADEVFLEPKARHDRTLDEDEFRRALLAKFFMRQPGTAIRRAAMDGHRPPRDDLRLPHDWEYFLRVLRGWRCRLVAEPLAVYRIHGGSLTVTSGQADRLRADMMRFLDIVSDPDDPAHVADDRERARLARGLAESYLGSIGPRLATTDFRAVADHTRWAMALAARESRRAAVGVVPYLARGAWKRLAGRRLRSTRPLSTVAPPR